MSMAINIEGKWMLPFSQYEHVDTVQEPLVPHQTRSGHKIIATHHLHDHYVVKDNIDETRTITVPAQCGVLVDFKIPEEYINRHIYNEKSRSDNIVDYIKAAADYLNIEIRYQAEYASWYTARFKSEPNYKNI